MRRFVLIVIALTFAVAIFGPILRSPGQPPKAPATRPQSDLDKLMQKKLQRAQKLLEGIAQNDMDMIKDNAIDLLALSKSAEFKVLKTPQYELHSNEFRRALDDMLKGAKDRSIDAATLAYVDMTFACVRCHKHVREVRITRGPEPESPDVIGVKMPVE